MTRGGSWTQGVRYSHYMPLHDETETTNALFCSRTRACRKQHRQLQQALACLFHVLASFWRLNLSLSLPSLPLSRSCSCSRSCSLSLSVVLSLSPSLSLLQATDALKDAPSTDGDAGVAGDGNLFSAGSSVSSSGSSRRTSGGGERSPGNSSCGSDDALRASRQWLSVFCAAVKVTTDRMNWVRDCAIVRPEMC